MDSRSKVSYVSDVEIILGTYEEFLLGYKINKLENKCYSLSNSFANHSHQASIRCCASSGQFLASGGADETIQLYDMHSRKEHGSLVHQNGTITCLEFHGKTHMFSGSEDGTLCVWRVGSWQCEKILKGHRGPITAMSIHPSGKLALSVGRDRSLRTWNLVKGRSAYVTNLASVKGNRFGVDTGAEGVKWSPDGILYAVSYRSKVDVYDLNIAGIVYSVDLGDRRIISTHFITDQIMAVGGESGIIEFHDVKKKKLTLQWKAYSEEERVRCLACIELEAEDKVLMVTCSSNGLIKLWKLPKNKFSEEPKCVGELNASCRVTCLTICTPSVGVKRKKRKNSQCEEVKIEDDKGDESSQDNIARVDELTLSPKQSSDSANEDDDDHPVIELQKKSKSKEQTPDVKAPKRKKAKGNGHPVVELEAKPSVKSKEPSPIVKALKKKKRKKMKDQSLST